MVDLRRLSCRRRARAIEKKNRGEEVVSLSMTIPGILAMVASPGGISKTRSGSLPRRRGFYVWHSTRPSVASLVLLHPVHAYWFGRESHGEVWAYSALCPLEDPRRTSGEYSLSPNRFAQRNVVPMSSECGRNSTVVACAFTKHATRGSLTTCAAFAGLYVCVPHSGIPLNAYFLPPRPPACLPRAVRLAWHSPASISLGEAALGTSPEIHPPHSIRSDRAIQPLKAHTQNANMNPTAPPFAPSSPPPRTRRTSSGSGPSPCTTR